MADESIRGYKPILSLIVFFITNFLVAFPFSVWVPSPLRLFGKKYATQPPIKLKFGLAVVPPLAVLFLLAAKAIDGGTIRRGILGADGIEPIDIMALFISLAYIAISLDSTGLLRFLAFYLVSRSTSGRRLYLYLYGLFFAFGVVVGNDPVILSGTAFLAYMTRVAGIVPPTAWIFAQFSVANIASAVLVSSNPTNLVLTGAFDISFTTYTANVVLPAFFSTVLLFPYLLWRFGSGRQPASFAKLLHPVDWLASVFNRNQRRTARDPDAPSENPDLIPKLIEAHDLPEPSSALVDPTGAKFGAVLLLLTLAALLATSAAGVHAQVWMITVPAALIMLARDIWWDIWGGGRSGEETAVASPEESFRTPSRLDNSEIELRPVHTEPPSLRRLSSTRSSMPGDNAPVAPRPDKTNVTSKWGAWKPIRFISRIPTALPTSYTIFTRLPFPLIPFAFSMFILVQALGSAWIPVFSGWWAAWAARTGTVGSVLGMYVISVLGCNFMGTNIGATILLARVLQRWIDASQPSSRSAKGAIYALALGSNYGAFSATFSASLAGLLWKQILNQKGIKVAQSEFAYHNFGINLVAMLVGCAVLIAQVYIVTS
ncbi:hypothetical protein FS837_007162 [Tulasnella sp. UAMH 9824]|nr:hypothetical protein FS837_007162 [Tulasnella sp. UAMH 9824]